MNAERMEELRNLAKQATVEDWYTSAAYRDYVEAVNPPTILSLLDELDRLRGAVDEHLAWCRWPMSNEEGSRSPTTMLALHGSADHLVELLKEK